LGERLQRGPSDPLHKAERNHLVECLGGPAHSRRNHERRDRDQEVTFASELPRDPSR
jgi:hypothetical protein